MLTRCADFNGHRSLLTCYEGDAMATSCPICQGEGRVAIRMAKARKSLDEIRAAIGALFITPTHSAAQIRASEPQSVAQTVDGTTIRIHVPLRVDSAAMEDVLTWSFPVISARGGTLVMHWARTRVSTDFTVTPTLSEALAEKDAAPCVGTYALMRTGPNIFTAGLYEDDALYFTGRRQP